jgi:hypothetical protein
MVKAGPSLRFNMPLGLRNSVCLLELKKMGTLCFVDSFNRSRSWVIFSLGFLSAAEVVSDFGARGLRVV